MLYINIYIFITCIYLSDDRKNINGFDVDDYYGLVICCGACFRRHRCRLWRRSAVSSNGRNGNGHSCCEEEFYERSATVVVASVEMFLSGLHNCYCLYGSFRLCTKRFEGMRMRAACGETTIYHVPIYGRQPCQLASISLCSLIWHAFFVGNVLPSPLHCLARPFLCCRSGLWTQINATPCRGPLRTLAGLKARVNLLFDAANIGKYPQSSK